MTSSEQAARAQQLRGYFDLQLEFAGRMAALTDVRLEAAVGLYTNLRLRMGLGDEDSAEDAVEWARYLAGVAAAASAAARLDWTQAFFAECRPDTAHHGRRRFGCFSFEAPDTHGLVRIHFTNQDLSRDVGPLARSRMPARLEELTAMFGHLQRTHHEARTVSGGSWLYNLDAYRRLFPPQYGDSRVAPTPPVRLQGSSSWGQFLDFRGQLKPDLSARFRDNLRRLAPQAPWLAFPFLALRTRAPVAAFYAYYGLN